MSRRGFFATAPKHLGSLLAEELERLGMREAREARGGARFVGRLEDGYRAAMWSRIANRVLLVLDSFAADDPDRLYAGALAFPWEDQLSADSTFAVRFEGTLPGIDNRQFGALRIKDAIADRFVGRLGRRPSVDPDSPDILIHCHCHGGEVTLSLDLAGESLHRRGYREQGARAPLKENLAAAILLRAGWPELAAGGGALVDPMCGSGTLVIEAALIAADIAPGLLAGRRGPVAWLGHRANAWGRLVEEARIRRDAGLHRLGTLYGSDSDPQAVRIALANLERAGLAGRVRFECLELTDCRPPGGAENGLVVVNPPYGERMGADWDLPGLYARLGRLLRERFPNWRAAVFTGDPELGKHMGLRAQRTHSMFNGPIECRLLHFRIEPQWFVSNEPRPLPHEERGEGAQMLANRLRKNLKSLRRWREAEGVSCYRLYDADLPEYAVAVDVYEAERCWAVVQEYAAPASVDGAQARRRLREALGVIPEVLETPQSQIYFKLRRQQRGPSQYERLGDSRRFHEVSEGGYRFLVNFEDYLDTGLFLDHRMTRALIGREAAGKRFLNLFGYTGTATVYAAGGGALSTTTVDMSRTYLDWAWRNLSLNGIAGADHELIQADCMEWLRQAGGRRQFGLVFLDPPTFSTSKRMEGTLDIQRDHATLIRAAAALLEPGGTLIFSNNLRKFRMDVDALHELAVENIGRETLPRDFARNPRIHNCWRIRRRT